MQCLWAVLQSIKKPPILFWCTNILPSPFIFFKVKKRRSETSRCIAWKFSQGNALFLSPTFSLSEGFPRYIIFSLLPSYTWAVIPLENNWASILAIQISQDGFRECRRALACSLSPSKQRWELSGWCQSETYCAQVKQQQGPSTAYLIEIFHNGRQIKEKRIAKCKGMTLSPSNAHHRSGEKTKLKLKQMQIYFIIHTLEP